MDDQLIAVGGWLQATLNPDKATRVAAEEALRAGETTPGYVVQLMKLAVDTSLPVDPVLRHTAVVYMKNVVKRRWDPPKPPPHRKHEAALEPLAEADKAVLRGNLIEAIAVAAPQVRSQLALCLKHVAFSDYPERWPDLLAQIGAKLRMTDNESQLHGGLLALRVLAKIHEYRQDTKAKNEIVGETFYVLLGMLRQLLSAAPTVAACELACLAAKVVHSCVCYELPTLLLSQPAAVDPFFEVLVGLLTQPLPPGAPTEADEAGNWAPWKLKKRVAQTLHRTLQRHGNPSASGGDSSAVAGGSAGEAAVAAQQAAKQALAAQKQAFARGFQDRWSARCLGGFLELVQLTREGSTTPLPPRVHNIALGYLDEAIKYKATYVSVLKPNLEALFSDVIYPPLCFSNDDAELWEDDPLEFVRRSFDIVEDFYSPRAGAQRLLVSLAEKRAKDCLHGFVVACSNILGTAAAAEAQGGVDDALLRRKDGALCAIAALERPLTKKDSPYRASLEGMLRQHVMPSLHSPRGFLRQRAASTYAAFASSVFKNAGKAAEGGGGGGKKAAAAVEPAAIEQINLVFPRLMELLRDPDLPVRVQAALTIKQLVEHGCLTSAVLSHLPNLLESLFALINEVGADDIVATLDTLIEHYGEQMAPYSVQVVQALVGSFLRLAEEAMNAGDDDNGDSTLAAMSALQALTTMCEAVHNMGEGKAPGLFMALEEPLLPLFVRCLEDESGDDFIDDALEVLNYITYHAKGRVLAPGYWELIPMMHAAFHDWGREYLSAMLGPLDNFISFSTETFLTLNNGACVTQILSICRSALVGEEDVMDETDLHAAPQLLTALLVNCRGRIDALIKDVVAILLMAFERFESVGMKVMLWNGISACLYYDAALTLQALEHRQQTQQVLQMWAQHLGTCDKLRVRDLKLSLLATCAMLALPAASGPAVVTGNRLMLLKLSATVIQKGEAVKQKKEQEAAEEDDDDEDEDEDDDDDDDEELGDDDDGEADDDDEIKKTLRKLGLKWDDDDLDEEDELEDDDDEESPIDEIDELRVFADVMERACAEDGALLARAGLGGPEQAALVEATAEEAAVLRKALEVGVSRRSANP